MRRAPGCGSVRGSRFVRARRFAGETRIIGIEKAAAPADEGVKAHFAEQNAPESLQEAGALVCAIFIGCLMTVFIFSGGVLRGSDR